MLEPAAERNEDEEHGRRLEEGHRRVRLRHHHRGDHHRHRVRVRDCNQRKRLDAECMSCHILEGLTGCGEHDEDVHVGGAVLQRLDGRDVEVHAAEELRRMYTIGVGYQYQALQASPSTLRFPLQSSSYRARADSSNLLFDVESC